MAKEKREKTRSKPTLARVQLGSPELVAAFNEQVGHEMQASSQYVQIAAYYAQDNLPELAAFFYRQADEERMHAMKFVHFLVEIDGKVEIPAQSAPRASFASAEEPVALSLQWESTVTEQIYRLVEIAKQDGNYIAQRFLDWFVTEQLEELSSMSTLLALIQRAGAAGLFYVEDFLARHGHTVPAGIGPTAKA